MAKKRKEFDDDDGRVIAPMNLDGMPWYVPERRKTPSQETGEPVELDRGGTFAFFKGVMLATFLVVGVFIGVFTIFILVLYLLTGG